MDPIERLEQSCFQNTIPEKERQLFAQFYTGYKKALEQHYVDLSPYESFLSTFLVQLREQILSPYIFEPYHRKIRQPFDYYQFGLDFLRPLIDMSKSSVQGHPHLEKITEKLQRGENVVFLANHQIEADPQAISILLEDKYPYLAEEMISVAGERVITDPLAIPFSMGRNLLCIYSKRYIDNPPELKAQKQLHNKKTMELMSALLSQGGCAIYVAPSGGRDRKDSAGILRVAPFDPQSIEMFYLMSKKAKKNTAFYPMALYTYPILPPPDTIQTEIGEARHLGFSPIHLWVGSEIDMEHFAKNIESDKKKRREQRAKFIWDLVDQAYKNFPC